MADIRRQGFHTVETNVEEMEQKIRRHRRNIIIRLGVLAVAAAAALAAVGIYFEFKEYKDYEVKTEIPHSDSSATKYEIFSNGILRYNNDGAFYSDLQDNRIWNQAYEMQNPIADICGNFVAVADRQGSQIYIMNISGVQGVIELNRPIEAVSVSGQGTVAVLTKDGGTSYLELYQPTGESLASGEIHMENSGYPLDIALSSDGAKLAVSILDISEGKAKTTVAFYNFGSVGQNEIDNIVGSYSYNDAIIPELHFASDDRLVAFGDVQVTIFEGTQKPKEAVTLELEQEVKSIFYDEEYFGLVYDDGDSGETYRMQVYDMGGTLQLEQEFQMAYQTIEFLSNHEICLLEERACAIYTLRGVEKFSCTFDSPVYKILSGATGRRYTFLLEGGIQKVVLK